MSTPTPGSDLPVRRIDRILSYLALGLLALSVVCFFAIMIGTVAHTDFSAGLWPTVGIAVYIAPVAAFIMLLIVLISSFVRRARANRAR